MSDKHEHSTAAEHQCRDTTAASHDVEQDHRTGIPAAEHPDTYYDHDPSTPAGLRYSPSELSDGQDKSGALQQGSLNLNPHTPVITSHRTNCDGPQNPHEGTDIHTEVVATLYLNDGSGRSYQLTMGSNIVGRGQDTHFRLPDTGVSRRHLNINWNGRIAFLSDLESTNGTVVNRTPVQEWQLADNDVIRIGHSEIIIHIH